MEIMCRSVWQSPPVAQTAFFNSLAFAVSGLIHTLVNGPSGIRQGENTAYIMFPVHAVGITIEDRAKSVYGAIQLKLASNEARAVRQHVNSLVGIRTWQKASLGGDLADMDDACMEPCEHPP